MNKRLVIFAALVALALPLSAQRADIEQYITLGRSLNAEGRYTEALAAALTGQGYSRYDPRLAEILAEASYHLGKNDDALRYYQEYITLLPEGAHVDAAYYYIGEIYIRTAKFSYADIALSTAVHYQPQNAHWWTRLAYARECSGEYAAAAAAYETALRLNGTLVDAERGLERVRAELRPAR